MKLTIVIFSVFYLSFSNQQLIPVKNEDQTSNSETIDGSFPGQGIPKALVDLFPQIDEATTTQKPTVTRWKSTVPDDERIPPAYRHLYPDPIKSVESTSEAQEEGKTEILTTSASVLPCNRYSVIQTTTSAITTTRKPRRRMRPGRRRKPIRDPAARARARQRAMEMDQRIPPAFAHLYTTAAPSNQTTTTLGTTSSTEMGAVTNIAKKSSRMPQTTTTVVEEEVKEEDVATRMASSRSRHYPDDVRIPPAYRHLYPASSNLTTTESPMVTSRVTQVETRRPTTPTDTFNDNDRKLLRELSDNFKLMVRLEDQHLKKLDSMENRLITIEETFSSKLNNLQDQFKSLVEKMSSLEDQKRRVDSALYLVRKNFSQIKSEIKEKSNSSDSRTLNDLMKRMALISSMVEDIQNRIDKTRLRKSLTHNSIEPNSSLVATGESQEPFPENCLDILNTGLVKTDIYRIYPRQSSMSFYVLCENGWTVIQNRNSRSLNFTRSWNDYRLGFGNIADEFWLGLEKIHILTNFVPVELLIELEDFDSQKHFAHYSLFSVGSETEGYALNMLGSYDGDAGDALKYHAGQKFSTYDKDNDAINDNCAQIHSGGWWYNDCGASDLNGLYINEDGTDQSKHRGMFWKTFSDSSSTLKTSRMLIRPVTKT